MKNPYSVGSTFPREVADIAHADDPFLTIHNNGFCRTCASIYLAVSKALGQIVTNEQIHQTPKS